MFESSSGIESKRFGQRIVESAVPAEFIGHQRSGCAEDSARYSKVRLLVISVALFCASAMPVHGATITVTNTNDNGPGSLRQALRSANNGDTINFAVAGTITLTSGGLPVNKNITISGPGADHLLVDGNKGLLVFGVFFGKAATISDLTIRNAQFGIVNEGTIVVVNCVLTANLYDGLYSYEAETSISNCVVAGNAGSGLFNDLHHGPNDPFEGYGSMTIADSIISDNSGTGVWNYGFLTILNSTLSGNSAGQAINGGGILSGTFKAPANVTVINSTISGNSASGGGGGIAIYYGSISIVNSTISGNSAAEQGGGILNFGGVQLANSTISGNSAGSGGGISNVAGQFGGIIEISNTIFNAGALGENISNDGGTITSHGYNISSDDGAGVLTGPGDQINTDPLLGPLRGHGGPTLTHMPLRGSPAIDAGDPNFTPPPDHDQRGSCFYRVSGGRIDVGSVETQPRPRCVTPAPRPRP